MTKELPIQINGHLGKLRGIIHSATSNKKGVVILLHGYFSSNKLGPVGLYVQIARIFAKHGYEFWRIDSYGIGDSDGNFNQSSFQLRIQDYKTIVNKALETNSKLYFLGHSMGTSIAVHLANYFSDYCEKIFLLSPSFGSFTWIENLFNPEQLACLQKDGQVERKGLLIEKDFIDEIISLRIYNVIQNCKSKIYIFYGLKDEFYDEFSIQKALKHMNDYRLYEIENADHNFLINKNLLLEKLKKSLKYD